MSNSSTSSTSSGAPGAQHPPAGGPPYPPHSAALGLVPSVLPDIPVCAALLALFLAAAAANVAIFRRNRGRGHKFLFSALLAAFCVARAAALALRCAWAVDPRSVRLGIAAQIFTAAGVVILFVTNLVFAQRVVRACHPFFGWRRAVTGGFGVLFGSAVGVLVAVVTATVHGFFEPDGSEAKAVDRMVQLVCGTYLALYAFLPVVLCALAVLVPGKYKIDKFGEGRFRTKVALLIFTASLLALGAGSRAAVAHYTRPLSDPAWFHSKVCYYLFNFGLELVVVITYAASRFDKRFHIPDGSSGPWHYSNSWQDDDGGDGAVELAEVPSSPSPVAKTPTAQSPAESMHTAVSAASSVYATLRSGTSLVSDEDWPSATQAMRELFGDDEEAQRLEDAQKPGPLPRIRISRSGDLVRGLGSSTSSETWAWLRGLGPYGSQPEIGNQADEEGGPADDRGKRTDEEGSQSDEERTLAGLEGYQADGEGSSPRSGRSNEEWATPSPSEGSR